jgi:hypothetical protein
MPEILLVIGSEWDDLLRDPDYNTSSEGNNFEELFSDNERKRARKSRQLNETETDMEITESSSIRVATDSLHRTEQNKPWTRNKRRERKKCRTHGKSYTTVKVKLMHERHMQPQNSCRRNCKTWLTEEACNTIFTEF